MRNLFHKLLKPALALGRIGVIFIALLALVMAGASSAMRLDQPQTNETEAKLPVTQVSLNQVPDENSPVAENMSPGSRPNAEPAAFLSQFLLSSGISYDQAKYRPIICKGWADFSIGLGHEHGKPIGTVGRVDSYLARSLTLVGSKPDGTS